MARSSFELIRILRNTYDKIESSNQYQWGHMGLCNCGFLAQEVTQLKKDEIHKRAMMRHGDWNEQLNDYCPTSGLPMDDVISALLAVGFDVDDLKHLERLSSPSILRRLPSMRRNLQRNQKADVLLYIKEWAQLLEDEFVSKIDVTDAALEKESFSIQR